jgi:hypothetical protein
LKATGFKPYPLNINPGFQNVPFQIQPAPLHRVAITFDLFGFMASTDATSATTALQTSAGNGALGGAIGG